MARRKVADKVDPFIKRRKLMVEQSEYRVIELGDQNMLRNGQMVQIAIADPEDPSNFHPTDKIILLKHLDQSMPPEFYNKVVANKLR
mmetsp:Transcript_10255/g.7664  ORF Transcript_10255/g.7664 Transcript_10255/m.7664 type:complete len:87 (-) Transcript_10255:839-1099(-)